MINERIRFPKVRVVGVDGEQLGIMTSREAQTIADDKELDLVLVSDKADPPVCKIIDHGKHKFEQEKKAKEAKKKHDYKVRLSQAQRFLAAGDKVKATIMFRGREIQHSDLAEVLLKRMATDLQEVAEIQQTPKKEGRNMMMLMAPKK